MFNNQDTFEEPNFLPSDFPPPFLSNIPLESFGADFYQRDDQNFFMPPADFEAFEQGFPFIIDPAIYQSFQEDFKRLIPGFEMFAGMGKDDVFSEVKPLMMVQKTQNTMHSANKIGTITVEERRQKVLKFLEKRKNRIFKKRISYACRKRVADSRVRVKGRFVTKEQAAKLAKPQNDIKDRD